MKKLVRTLVSILLAGALFACGNGASNAPAASEAQAAAETFAAYDGTYAHENSSAEFSGEVKLKFLGESKMSFEITVGASNGCAGELKGEALIDQNSVATYSGELCEALRFYFEKSKVRVEETACDGWHGMRCGFDGTYLKK